MSRLFSGISKFFRNLFNIGGTKISNAADELYTKDVAGVKAAWTEYGDSLKEQYEGMENAVGKMQMVVEQERQKLEKSHEVEGKLIKRRNGALKKAQQAKAAEDTKTYEDMKVIYSETQTKIAREEEKQNSLTQKIEESQLSLDKHMRNLRKLHEEVQSLPEQEAENIADFIGAQSTLEFNRRMSGLTKSTDRSGIDAVMSKTRELTAQAKVSDVMSGADSAAVNDELEALGESDSADDFDAVISAMEAEENAKTGKTPDAELPDTDTQM